MNDLFVGHFFYPTPIIYSSLYKCTWFTGFNWFLTNLSVRRRLSQRRRKYKNKRTFSACRIAEEILIFSIIIYSLCIFTVKLFSIFLNKVYSVRVRVPIKVGYKLYRIIYLIWEFWTLTPTFSPGGRGGTYSLGYYLSHLMTHKLWVIYKLRLIWNEKFGLN